MQTSAAPPTDIFGRAARYLADPTSAPPPDDVAALLRTVEYDSDPGDAATADNRIALLRAAGRFARVFQLGAPEAPGLFFLGAEMSPGMIAAGHAEAPLANVGGMGLSMRAAFESCIGEGVELLSQFEDGSEPLAACGARAMLDTAVGEARTYLEGLLSATGMDATLDCLKATSLTGDATLLVPAEVCLRRLPTRSRLTPPFLLSTGCAAGRTWADAVLHGLCELVERDAAGLWWCGGARGRPLALEDPASSDAAGLLTALRRDNRSRRTWLLDITTDLGIPAVAALSCHADGSGFACGLGARPTLVGAARGAIMELTQSELAHAVVAAKLAEGGEARLNARDRDHLARATRIDAGTYHLLHPLGVPARHEPCTEEDHAGQIRWLTARLSEQGIEPFVIDLTRPAFAIPVVRVIAPGLQIEPSDLESPRLRRAILAAGQQITHEVPLF